MGNLTIFIHGCQSCGIAGTWVKRAQKYAAKNNIECEVRNSKYSEEDRIEHAINLKLAGLDADTYQPIVKDGTTITRLRDFNK